MVVRDLEDPVAELVAGLVRVDGVERPDERLLRQVLGQGAIAHHAVDQGEHRPLVSRQQLAERRLVSLRGTGRELAIVELFVVRSGQGFLVLPGVRVPEGGARQGSGVGAHHGALRAGPLVCFAQAVEPDLRFP